ncbi:MAG: SIS domain-containing protein, partial [candidate division Zixibacteria bacterium]|nr:SIS domain-containing protein [candidate division Zixibacteria bacterium]
MADYNDKSAIKGLDKSEMYSKLIGFPNQVRDAFSHLSDIKLPSLRNDAYANIIIAGMGGSAIGGDFVRALLLDESTIPVFVVRDYSLPRFVSKDSLVIAVSYSGNTEEVIAAYREARKRGSICVVVSCGGELSSIARNEKVPLITVKEGFHPREAVGYLLLSIYHILGETRLFSIRLEDSEMLGSFLEQSGLKLVSEVSEGENSAKFIA